MTKEQLEALNDKDLANEAEVSEAYVATYGREHAISMILGDDYKKDE